MNERKQVKIDTRTLVYGEIRQSGGDPSTLFEILEGVIDRRDWETLFSEDGQPVGSFQRFLESPPPNGCGVRAEKLLALLKVEHRYETDADIAERMQKLRERIEQELQISA